MSSLSSPDNQGKHEHAPQVTATSVKKSAPKPESLILIIGIIFIAANLRAPLTSVGPLVNLIRENLNISNTLAGMLTTLPVLAFALFSPFAPGLARRFGIRQVLFWAIVFLSLGIILRSSLGISGLFGGTAILGLAISLCNVLMPSLIKQDFPARIGLMTGVYSVAMNTAGAIASGISIPLAVGSGMGWSGALAIWVTLSCISILIWIPQFKQGSNASKSAKSSKLTKASHGHQELQYAEAKSGQDAGSTNAAPGTNLWKSALAWQVTGFMGLQALVFYSMVAWLPEILIQKGMNSGTAGWMLSLMQMALIPFTFIVSVLAERSRNQRLLVTIGSFCQLSGILGLLFGGLQFSFLWIILLGIGGGFVFSLAMMFFILRTRSADEAARLSGMAQAMGYLLAAFAPMLFGYLHDQTGNWTVPLIDLSVVSFACYLTGLGASRDIYVSLPEQSQLAK